jgi:hypothetical protein
VLSFSRQEFHAMTREEILEHVLFLQSSREAASQPTLRLSRATLSEMSKENLTAHALVLQSEIEWARLSAMTSPGASDAGNAGRGTR